MPVEPPPARYRVIERGRRLEVIDTWSRERPPPMSRAAVTRRAAAAPLGAITKTSFDGRAQLVTSTLYDGKGPRAITLDPTSARIFAGTRIAVIALALAWIVAAAFVPALFVLVIPLFSTRLWRQMRQKTTDWLNRAAAGAA